MLLYIKSLETHFFELITSVLQISGPSGAEKRGALFRNLPRYFISFAK